MLDLSAKYGAPVGRDTESLKYAGHACTSDLDTGDSALRALSLLIVGDRPRARVSTGVMELVESEYRAQSEHSSESVFFEYYDVVERGHLSELFPEIPSDGVAPLWAIFYLVKQQPYLAPTGPLSRHEPNVFEIDADHVFIEGSRTHGWSLYLGSELDSTALYPGARLFGPVDVLPAAKKQ